MTAQSSDQADVEFLHTDKAAVVKTSRNLAENRNRFRRMIKRKWQAFTSRFTECTLPSKNLLCKAGGGGGPFLRRCSAR